MEYALSPYKLESNLMCDLFYLIIIEIILFPVTVQQLHLGRNF